MRIHLPEDKPRSNCIWKLVERHFGNNTTMPLSVCSKRTNKKDLSFTIIPHQRQKKIRGNLCHLTKTHQLLQRFFQRKTSQRATRFFEVARNSRRGMWQKLQKQTIQLKQTFANHPPHTARLCGAFILTIFTL